MALVQIDHTLDPSHFACKIWITPILESTPKGASNVVVVGHLKQRWKSCIVKRVSSNVGAAGQRRFK